MDLWVDLGRRGDRSAAIYRALVQAIDDGRLRPGDRLPPMRALATDLGVSRSTVAGVYERLTAEGYLRGRVGAGTFVTEAAIPGPDARPTAGTGAAVDPEPLRPKPSWDQVPVRTSSADEQLVADFRVGIPDPALFPFDPWRRLVGSQLRRRTQLLGTYSEPAGDPRLRRAIAGHLGRSRSVRAAPDDVVVTNGTQQALDLVARVLLEAGDVVAVEDPGYPRARDLLRSHGARVVPVPVDAEGIEVQRIPPATKLVFTTPSHQFPLGVPMSLARRRELLGWAAANGAAIFEDDYDSEFRFAPRPLEPLHALDGAGRVIYAGTFSKSLLPSLRLGFLVAPESLREPLRAARQLTDWHGVTVLQAALATFIDEGLLAAHLRRAGGVYRHRREAMLTAIAAHLGDRVEVIPSAAGLHVTAVARPGQPLRSAALVDAARTAGIGIEGLAAHFAGRPTADGLVLGYGTAQLESIDAGLAVVGRLLRRSDTAP